MEVSQNHEVHRVLQVSHRHLLALQILLHEGLDELETHILQRLLHHQDDKWMLHELVRVRVILEIRVIHEVQIILEQLFHENSLQKVSDTSILIWIVILILSFLTMVKLFREV